MIRFTGILIVSAISLAGCVSPVVSTVKDTRTDSPNSAPKIKPTPEQPLRDPDAYRSKDSGRLYSLTLKNADLRDVLVLLSKESGVSIVAERGLRGNVQIEAKNKKLGELLYMILKPLGYTASVENGMVLVGRPKLATRTFRVNYLKDKRSSASNMNVSGFSAGSVSVSSAGQSDFWGALENSLEMLVFGTSGKGKRESGGFSISEDEKKSDGKTTSSAVSPLSKDKPQLAAAAELEDPLLSSTQIAEGQLKQLVVNEIAGIIQVTDLPENLDKIASFLADVEEGSKRQVLIQAHIMEVNLKDSYSLGLDWQQVFQSTDSAFTIGQALAPATNVFKFAAEGFNSFGRFNLLLDAMKEQGNVNMLSSPKISALNNQKAVIKLTTKQVSWVSSKTTNNSGGVSNDTFSTTPQIDEVGIFLDVTPQIGFDNSITMQIHPSVSEIKEISTSPDKSSTKPVIDIREIDTMVDAKAGETIVIAGLISDKLNETKRSVPLLGDIPYLGTLFSYSKQERTKSELVIMMTPYILNAKSIDEIRAEHEQRMQNSGGDFHLINNLGSMVTEKNSRDWIMRSEPHRLNASSAPNKPAEPEPAKPVSSPSRQPDAAPLTPAPAPASPEVRIPVTAPERNDTRPVPDSSLQQMERQQSEIKRLEREVTTAWELLNNERRKNIELSTETRQPAVTPAEPKTVRPEIMPIIAEDTKPTAAAGPTIKANLAEQPVTMTANVQTTSPTGDREQILYRSAVVAYKIGDCAESIKFFDQFLTLYPNSPFAQDAVYYRKDCADRK
ncbi:MAG: hypothetical protein RW306_14655 [Geobacteraceae bacterium]|nr:hypothetical protein [Geobacteraceae bacterium]